MDIDIEQYQTHDFSNGSSIMVKDGEYYMQDPDGWHKVTNEILLYEIEQFLNSLCEE